MMWASYLVLFSGLSSAPDSTECSRCHTTDGWIPAQFEHDKTGFALKARHQNLRCGACHPATNADHQLDFAAKLPQNCVGCHRDPHRSELGTHCESCHDEQSWQSKFDAIGHRRTAFPLFGPHAAIPCEECHTDRFTLAFARASVSCQSCHQDDFTRAKLASIDHMLSGFSERCLDCHRPTNFKDARFPEHALCFQLENTSHANLSCLSCHQNIAGKAANLKCETGDARCTSCHAHSIERTTAQHRSVSGFQPKDRKCYECHQFRSQ